MAQTRLHPLIAACGRSARGAARSRAPVWPQQPAHRIQIEDAGSRVKLRVGRQTEHLGGAQDHNLPPGTPAARFTNNGQKTINGAQSPDTTCRTHRPQRSGSNNAQRKQPGNSIASNHRASWTVRPASAITPPRLRSRKGTRALQVLMGLGRVARTQHGHRLARPLSRPFLCFFLRPLSDGQTEVSIPRRAGCCAVCNWASCLRGIEGGIRTPTSDQRPGRFVLTLFPSLSRRSIAVPTHLMKQGARRRAVPDPRTDKNGDIPHTVCVTRRRGQQPARQRANWPPACALRGRGHHAGPHAPGGPRL